MIDEFIFNEINNITVNARSLKIPEDLIDYSNITIVSNDTAVSYYLVSAMGLIKGKFEAMGGKFPNLNFVLDNSDIDNNFISHIKKNIGNVNLYSKLKNYKAATHTNAKTLFFYFSNLKDKKYENDEVRIAKSLNLTDWFELASEIKDSTFILSNIIPDIDRLPDSIMGISEREYEVLFHHKGENSIEAFLLKLEDIARLYIDKMSVKVARLDNVIGPNIFEMDGSILTDYISEIKEKNTITVKESDNKIYYSATYITSACLTLLQIATAGNNGNIYNVSSWSFTKFDIAYHLYNIFSDYNVQLITDTTCNYDGHTEYHILNPKKLLFINTSALNKRLNSYNLKYAVTMVASSILGDNNHYELNRINVYYGKIDIIRKLELEILNEVDKICRENNIKYFIAGGTMLGAIRHKGFIPWDDDVDIAMLPDEYEKFLKVCPQNLSVEHSYQTTDLEPTSLYVHDKIRLKGTFFSTKYSNQFLMENGVYIDVFIYYKTSDNPKKQNRHIRQIQIMRRLMGMRWVNYPRQSVHYYFSKIALPFMRLFSLKTFKRWYIKLISKYEKKDTHFLLDSTGLNLQKVRSFPKEWFDEMIEVEFEGKSYPIPKRYDAYLRHWYGEHYMDLLPISMRTSVHDVVRIDLGKYVIPEGKNMTELHEVDLRGELFEQRK